MPPGGSSARPPRRWAAASRVEWVSETCGDGVGFDILSFDDADDGLRFIEVKTTGLGKYFPFLVTENELRCSEDLTDRFQLYRVFDFSRQPMVYSSPTGALSKTCQRHPVQYRALVVAQYTDRAYGASCSDGSECDAVATPPCRVAYIARSATTAPAMAPKIIPVIEI